MKSKRWLEVARYLDPRFWIRLAEEFQWRMDDLRALRRRVDALESRARRLRDDLVAAKELVEGHGTEESRLLRHDGFLHAEAVILGSGPSVLELNGPEREHVRRQATIGMNRYYLFEDLIDVVPRYVYIGDYGPFATELFLTYCRKARTSPQPPVFLLESYYRLLAPAYLKTLFFHRRDGRTNLKWGLSLDGTLFNHRGSLTTLLNVCGILRLAPHIRLVGVDLERPGHFFDGQRDRYPQFFGALDDKANRTGFHSTMVYLEEMGEVAKESILTHWAEIMGHLANTGIRVTCHRSDNPLVRKGLCDYSPIPSG